MPTHPVAHFFWTLGFLAATGLALAVVRSRMVKRRLLFSGTLFLIAMAAHVAILKYPALRSQIDIAEYFIIAFGVITAVVTLLLNPWFRDRSGDGVPAIVQDTSIAVIAGIASLVIFQSPSFIFGITGSAIVLGLALQDTLGNAFAGLAIQVERPFRVGHWIAAGDQEGRVIEITWRATKIRTKSGDLVVLPNSVVSQQAIHNYSEPAAPTRLFVEVGIAYETPPNDARDALLAAMHRTTRVLRTPEPDVLVTEFAASAITYRARFWLDDFETTETTKSEVRSAIYYELRRRGLEIPWPIQVEYHREDNRPDAAGRHAAFRETIGAVPVLAGLRDDAKQALAQASAERLFAAGEVIVREGDAGDTMFIVRRGRVAITVGPNAVRVAVTEAGGYFGEMSLLTGEPRTATVTAEGDCVVLEIAADVFGAYVRSHPEVIETLAATAASRRKALDENRSAGAPIAAADRHSLAQRMRKFFGLD